MLSLKPFRRASVPLLAVQTADPANIIALAVREAVNGTTTPVLRWDCIHGIEGANSPGADVAKLVNLGPNGEQLPAAIATGNPIEA